MKMRSYCTFSVASFLMRQQSSGGFHVSVHLPETSFEYLPIINITAPVMVALWLILLYSSSASRTIMSDRMFSESQNMSAPNSLRQHLVNTYLADEKGEAQNGTWIDRSDGQEAAESKLKASA